MVRGTHPTLLTTAPPTWAFASCGAYIDLATVFKTVCGREAAVEACLENSGQVDMLAGKVAPILWVQQQAHGEGLCTFLARARPVLFRLRPLCPVKSAADPRLALRKRQSSHWV
jgi:hypothetical protein